MHFFAHLKPKSSEDRKWRAARMQAAFLEGINFVFNPRNNLFESPELTESQIDSARKHPSIVLESTTRSIPHR